jgi:hypothetical protein
MQFRERTTPDKWKTAVLANIKRKLDLKTGGAKAKDEDQGEMDAGENKDFDPF